MQRDAQGRPWTLLGSPLALAGGAARVGPPIEPSLEPDDALRWWHAAGAAQQASEPETETETADAPPMETR